MGGYDLNGRYYPNTADAINAELAQMSEIDNRLQSQIIDELKRKQNNTEWEQRERMQRDNMYLNQIIDDLASISKRLKAIEINLGMTTE